MRAPHPQENLKCTSVVGSISEPSRFAFGPYGYVFAARLSLQWHWLQRLASTAVAGFFDGHRVFVIDQVRAP